MSFMKDWGGEPPYDLSLADDKRNYELKDWAHMSEIFVLYSYAEDARYRRRLMAFQLAKQLRVFYIS